MVIVHHGDGIGMWNHYRQKFDTLVARVVKQNTEAVLQTTNEKHDVVVDRGPFLEALRGIFTYSWFRLYIRHRMACVCHNSFR